MIRAKSISSVPYATDERASDEKTARPVTLERRSCFSFTDSMGVPIRILLSDISILSFEGKIEEKIKTAGKSAV
jgi:hypothetical protein